MKGAVKFVSKLIIVGLVFAQTSAADTGINLPVIGSSGINEPLYLTLCGIGLLLLGARSRAN